MIDRATVQKIKDTANIVDVVGKYVHLIKSGANYKGLCPFHNERTPSFSVNPARNFCYCFSCHKGGSPINFIMEKEGLSYPEALRHLAKEYGIKIEEREETSEEVEKRQEREAMMFANEWALGEMEHNLHETPDGQDIGLRYFYERGVTEEAIRKFRLGYTLDNGRAMVEAAIKRGIDTDVLVSLGLLKISKNDPKNLYGAFRGRVMFPIFTDSGKVVAFGGRDLKGDGPKYLNSPQSPVYSKRRELYGFFQAKGEIQKSEKCFIVEGYMDVIGMWQGGLKNVVASCGTALTAEQIALIHRFAPNVTLIYDGDSAGIKATLSGIDLLLSQDMKVKVLLLPDGHDPDSFSKANTPEQFRKYIAEHETDFINYKINVLLSTAKDDPQKKIEVLKSVTKSIAFINDKIDRFVYIQECSRLFDISEQVIAEEVERSRGEVLRMYQKQRDLNHIDKLDQEHQGQPDTPSISSAAPATVSDNSQSSPGSVTGEVTGLHGAAVSQNVRQRLTRSSEKSVLPLERRLCELIVRYGLLDFCEAETEEDEGENPVEMINVAEFISDELGADNITLTHPVYASILNTVTNMREDLMYSKQSWTERIEEEVKQMRKEGQDQIALASLPLDEIRIQERLLEERLKEWKENQWREYLLMYPGRELASCEDPEVRGVVTELLCEPYELSKIFFRDRTPEREADKLDMIVPRAILELKDAILGQKIRELMSKMQSAESDDQEDILRQIQGLANLRNQLSKDIGERIICAK